MSGAPHKVLQYKLAQLRDNLEQRQQGRRQQRLKDLKNRSSSDEKNLPTKFILSADVKVLLEAVVTSVMADTRRLITPPLETAAIPAETVSDTTPPLPPAMLDFPSSAVFKVFADGLKTTLPLLPQASGLNPLPPRATNPAIYAFLMYEFTLWQEAQAAKANVPLPLLTKLKQATQAYAEGRTTDTVTLLKNALNGDPHNHSLLCCLSQVLYGLGANNANSLPEARETAHRSTIAGEKQRPERLALYRYLAVVTERAFDDQRTLEWLRDSELLDAKMLAASSAGLMADGAIPLRAWALLSTISPTLWGEAEFKNMLHLVSHVVGGALVYVAWLRTPLMQAIPAFKNVPSEIEEAERLVGEAYAEYLSISSYLGQMPLRQSSLPWIVRVQWLNTLAEIAKVPGFDHILTHISLDAQSWRENIFPDREVQALMNDSTLNYWRIWAQAITPYKDTRKSYLLPTQETVQDADLLTDLDTLLTLLKNAETERLKADLWPDLKPWLIRWTIDHLLATATGSNQPRNRFAPNLSPYSGFYRKWQEPPVVGLLTSEIIAETGKRGGFASLFEVLAAFEGAMRLLDNPTHGLVATQRRAFDAARKQYPAKFNNRKADFGRRKENALGIMLAPLGLMGGIAAAVTLSENTSQAIGMVLALLGLAGVVMLNLGKK